ncbi:MAG: G-D-S-L family lipolytic protein, partial [Gammaproteobacteria bacterium]|nr:G-D-S-L family lipolytic protein [Gammaproteobacteria bacterium]
PILILDEALTDLTGVPGTGGALINLRQATPNDFIVLPASSKLGTEQIPGNPTTVWGVSNPLVDADVLTEAEVAIVEAARVQFNAAIKAAADGDPTLVLFDAAAKLTELNTSGINYGSGGVSSTFAQGGAFSLDGVHPTARGYAVIANEIMKVIEEAFGANIPPVDPNEYTTVFYQ